MEVGGKDDAEKVGERVKLEWRKRDEGGGRKNKKREAER